VYKIKARLSLFNKLNKVKQPATIMPDAKEWEKVAENLAKTRRWLFNLSESDRIDGQNQRKIGNVIYLLMIALEEVDKLARYDGEGWL
jgi:hypothetical protein